MKQTYYILSVLILSFITSCKNEPKAESPSFDFIKTYAGNINNKYPVHIKLNADSGKIIGTYFYDKVGVDIEVKGQIASDSTITLNEFDQKGNQTGLWSGKLINENKISGIWSKPNGNSAKGFTLILSSDNYDNSKKVIADSKFSKYNGTYNSPFNDGGISFGRLIVKYNQNKEIEFNITTAHQSDCTGVLKGIAKINESGIANYSGSGCKNLTFKFTKDQVSIKEKDCDQHGMRCYFSGVYKK